MSAGGPYGLSNIAQEPSLAGVTAAERQRFGHFSEESIRLEPAVGTRTIMLHSRTLLPGTDSAEASEWLLAEVAYLAVVTQSCAVRLRFKYCPAKFAASLPDFRRVKANVGSTLRRLTLDIGPVVFAKTPPVREVIAESGDEMINFQREDIQGRKHLHRRLGNGDIDFADVLRGLQTIGCGGLINAEFDTNDLEVDECRLARQTLAHLRQRM